MQLLDPLKPRSLNDIPERLLTPLHDMVHQIQIEADFRICHPDYQPLELSEDVLERFQQLPPDLRHKYLSLQLRGFLYGIYYNASLTEALAVDTDADQRALHQNLENTTFLGVDVAFYERLHHSNCGEGYFDPDWQVMREASDGSLVVTKGGLTLHIDRDRHLRPNASNPAVGTRVEIRLPPNRVQNGFYMAVGNHRQPGLTHQDTVRIYFNLNPEGAVILMEKLTQQLNALEVPFNFKALYNPSDYGRYDAAVLYFAKTDYPAIHQALQTIYRDTQTYFSPQVPLFTKPLAPGLGVAEEPNQKFAELESFGLNRCQIVANGLLEAWQRGEHLPEQRFDAILRQFALLGLEIPSAHLNANSEDIYTPLEL